MAMNPCVVPQPASSDAADGNRWMHIHNRFVSETKDREPDVVIFGQAHMCLLEQRTVWKEVFAPMHILNFSIIGDRIQQILWRMQNGELDNIKPKAVVVYCGDLDVRSGDPQLVLEGMVMIVKEIKTRQPNAQIFVQEVLPRGLHPNPLRDGINKFNSLLRNSLQDNPGCKVVPVGDGIIKADGAISTTDLFDWYYPTNEGCLKAFEPLIQELKSVLQRSTP